MDNLKHSVSSILLPQNLVGSLSDTFYKFENPNSRDVTIPFSTTERDGPPFNPKTLTDLRGSAVLTTVTKIHPLREHRLPIVSQNTVGDEDEIGKSFEYF
jgi:hypothetical protein